MDFHQTHRMPDGCYEFHTKGIIEYLNNTAKTVDRELFRYRVLIFLSTYNYSNLILSHWPSNIISISWGKQDNVLFSYLFYGKIYFLSIQEKTTNYCIFHNFDQIYGIKSSYKKYRTSSHNSLNDCFI